MNNVDALRSIIGLFVVTLRYFHGLFHCQHSAYLYSFAAKPINNLSRRISYMPTKIQIELFKLQIMAHTERHILLLVGRI
jgi:hypothetical protein